MKRRLCLGIAIAVLGGQAGFAQEGDFRSYSAPTKMEMRGSAVHDPNAWKGVSAQDLAQFSGDIPTGQLSKLVANPITEVTGSSRSAKDAQLYRSVSPSVVLVANKEGFGSGSLLDAYGNILTNWHVVGGYQFVAVIFKPTVEGKEPTRDDIKLARVVKYDEITDLALIKASEVPTGRSPIRLANSGEISVGMDVHAIGHPEGETWTYTTGIISQYRQAYQWKAKDAQIIHKADIIQTQTPINPGNSGGPLLSDAGELIGVNTFKDTSGEGLNFAVSVDDAKRFLARSESRRAEGSKKAAATTDCKPIELSRFRSDEEAATVISFDMFCTGKDNAEYVTPDDQSKAIFIRLDRNGDGRVDATIFDLKRRGKWDISFWDEKFEGHWTLVGYHDDGTLKPTRFESYAEFQKRIASR
jgi:S1-C subfamily serine protease